MTPANTDRTTNSATESVVGPADEGSSCFECGNDEVLELRLITMGTYLETLCLNPWACWERQVHRPV